MSNELLIKELAAQVQALEERLEMKINMSGLSTQLTDLDLHVSQMALSFGNLSRRVARVERTFRKNAAKLGV